MNLAANPILPILLVEPDALARTAVSALLVAADLHVMSAACAGEAIPLLTTNRFGLVAAETILPDLAFPAFAARVRDLQPAPVVALTGETDAGVLADALTAGASGVLSKYADPGLLAARIALCARGGLVLDEITVAGLSAAFAAAAAGAPARVPNLPRRELDVLELIDTGLSLAAVARRLTLAESTVKSHAAKAAVRLGAATSKEAARIARRHGLLTGERGERGDLRGDEPPQHRRPSGWDRAG